MTRAIPRNIAYANTIAEKYAICWFTHKLISANNKVIVCFQP